MTIVQSCITLGKIFSELPCLGRFLEAVRNVVTKSDWEYSKLQVLARLAEEWGNPRDDLFWAVIVRVPEGRIFRCEATGCDSPHARHRTRVPQYESFRMYMFPKQRPGTLVEGIM